MAEFILVRPKLLKQDTQGIYILFRNNKRLNKFLQNDFNKCGEKTFVFEVLEIIEGTKLDRTKREKELLDQYYDNQKQCYNIRKQTQESDRSCFSKTPEETRKKQIESWDNNPERRQKMSDRSKIMIQNGLKEKLHNDESKQKRNEALKQYHIDRHKELYSKPIIETRDFEHKGIHCKTVLNANLLSPKGILYRNITNVQKFAEHNNLSENKVRDLINGKFLSFKDWVRIIDKPIIEKSSVIYRFLSPEEKVVEITNISEFARAINLKREGFKCLISGRLKSYYGWKLFNKL